jgi:hypothetical protein
VFVLVFVLVFVFVSVFFFSFFLFLFSPPDVNLRLSVNLRWDAQIRTSRTHKNHIFISVENKYAPGAPAVQHDILEDILRPTLLSGQDIRALL